MPQLVSTAPVEVDRYLAGRGYRPESVRTIVEEALLPRGLIDRLHTLYPEHSRLGPVAPPLFAGKENFSGLGGFREVCSVLEANGIECRTAPAGELSKAAGAIGCLTGVLWREPA